MQLLILLIAFTFIKCSSDDNEELEPEPELVTVTDIDGNVYNTITLGNQTWMLENLKVTTFNDGTPIAQWAFGESWGSLNDQQALYQWANTNDLNDVVDFELPFDYYGAMYNHFAIESGKLAPEGWRIPTVEDFEALESYLVFTGYAGNIATALKSDSGWSEFSGAGTDAISLKKDREKIKRINSAVTIMLRKQPSNLTDRKAKA